MENQPPVSIALDKLGIAHTVFHHAGQVNSLEQAAQERNQRLEQVVRSILFRLSGNEYLMVLVAGTQTNFMEGFTKAYRSIALDDGERR